jgi:hypothetical protein
MESRIARIGNKGAQLKTARGSAQEDCSGFVHKDNMAAFFAMFYIRTAVAVTVHCPDFASRIQTGWLGGTNLRLKRIVNA